MRRIRSLYENYPKLVEAYWDNEKNRTLELYPSKVFKSSKIEAWFRCSIDNHSWQTTIGKITYYWQDGKNGCPLCRTKKKVEDGLSLVDNYAKQLKKYWDYEKNEIDPKHFGICSNKKAFFKCPIDGHRWSAVIENITNSWSNKQSGCPACRGFAITKHNALINLFPYHVEEYWDYEKNDLLEIYPDKVTKGSNKKAWFKCPVDGHQWYSTIASITNSWLQGNSGCYVCKLFYQSTKKN